MGAPLAHVAPGLPAGYAPHWQVGGGAKGQGAGLWVRAEGCGQCTALAGRGVVGIELRVVG